ncbi:MAG: hypothetical protein AAGI34_05535 [Pseudomonadota bacterium]
MTQVDQSASAPAPKDGVEDIVTLQGARAAVTVLRMLTAPDSAPIPQKSPAGGLPYPNWPLELREQLAAVPEEHRAAGEAIVAMISALEGLPHKGSG